MINVGVAGVGAIGSVICEAICDGRTPGMRLNAIANLTPTPYDSVRRPLAEFAEHCDIIVEALPPDVVSELALPALKHGKTLILSSTGVLVTAPEILQELKRSKGRIIGPYGALSHMPGIKELKNKQISKAQIRSTKPPAGFGLKNQTEPKIMFDGTAEGAVKMFGKNANVSASLAFGASLAANNVKVTITADPAAEHNMHHITAHGPDGTFDEKVMNKPDPSNPKTSLGTAESVLDALLDENESFFILEGGARL